MMQDDCIFSFTRGNTLKGVNDNLISEIDDVKIKNRKNIFLFQTVLFIVFALF